jgi:hypothetical protein
LRAELRDREKRCLGNRRISVWDPRASGRQVAGSRDGERIDMSTAMSHRQSENRDFRALVYRDIESAETPTEVRLSHIRGGRMDHSIARRANPYTRSSENR